MHTESFHFLTKDNETLHMVSDRGEYGILVRDFWGNLRDIKREEVLKCQKIEFKPTPAEIWELSGRGREINQWTKDKERKTPEPLEQIICAIENLLKYDFLKVDTLNYYHGGKRTEHLKNSLASNLGVEISYFEVHEDDTPELADWRKAVRSALLTWITNPTTKTWKSFEILCTKRWIEKEFLVDSGTECYVTNEIFRWSFDGTTFKPAYRFISNEEATPEELRNSQFDAAGNKRSVSRFILRKVTPFPYKDGHLPRLELELDCPTGHLIFANSLYDVFGEGDIYQFDINTEQGRQDQAHHLHKLGAWHIFNYGRGQLYKKGDEIVIGSWPEYEIEESKLADPTKSGWISAGDVSGPLRWFYACDEGSLPDNWMTKLVHQDENIVRLQVTPGRYKLINLLEHMTADVNGAFARIIPSDSN